MSLNKFKEKGYPEINLYEDFFEIKAFDYWEFRTFNYSEVKTIKIIDSRKKWYFQLYQILFFCKTRTCFIKNSKKNEGFWDYSAKNECNSKFNAILQKLKNRISN